MTLLDPSDDHSAASEFVHLLSMLGPVEARIVHLAMSRAAELEAAGRGGEADTLLATLLAIVEQGSEPWIEDVRANLHPS